jgi:hypothetical protein
MYHDVHRLLVPLLDERRNDGNTKASKTWDILDY